MANTVLDNFKSDLTSQPLDWVADNYIFEGTPFVFKDQPESTRVLIDHLSAELGLMANNLRIIGSAKIGFSLDPNNFPRDFTDRSDIDVLVVDEQLFDTIWMIVLKWHYPRRIAGLFGDDHQWMRKRRKDLYWGWLHPDKIRYEGLSLPEVLRPLRDISTKWFNAFHSLSLYSELSGRNVSGRLYRSWDHARSYHCDTLQQIKDNIA